MHEAVLWKCSWKSILSWNLKTNNLAFTSGSRKNYFSAHCVIISSTEEGKGHIVYNFPSKKARRGKYFIRFPCGFKFLLSLFPYHRLKFNKHILWYEAGNSYRRNTFIIGSSNVSSYEQLIFSRLFICVSRLFLKTVVIFSEPLQLVSTQKYEKSFKSF